MKNELQFAKGLEQLINQYSMENGSDTPDFILAGFLVNCLRQFDSAVREREHWHGRAEFEQLVSNPDAPAEAGQRSNDAEV